MVPTGAYGTWPSPIDAALAASHDGRPEYLGVVGDEVWWTAPRPAEGGRRALVRRRPDGAEESVLPAPWNVRSRVIEYGGIPWAGVDRAELGPLVVFVHFPDQRLYAYEPDRPGAEPRPLTPVSDLGGGLRWADPQLRPERGEVWCVLEEFTGPSPHRRPPGHRRRTAGRLRGRRQVRGTGTQRRPAPFRHRAAAVARRDQGGMDRLGPSADAVGRHRRHGR
jgi:hypothetical protein